MIRALALALLLPALPATAQGVVVRSGEHPGFTRLVVEGASDRDWILGRTGTGYALRLGNAASGIDLSGAFRAIGRTRIAGLSAAEPGTLRVDLGCACHAEPFMTETGLLVIDIRDGAPAEDSPWEVPWPGDSGSRTSPQVAADPALPGPPLSLPGSDADEAARRLAFYWRPKTAAAVAADRDAPDAGAGGAPAALGPPAEDVEPPAAPAAPEPARPATAAGVGADLRRLLDRAETQGLVEVAQDAQEAGVSPGRLPADAEAAAAGDATGWPGLRGETAADRDAPPPAWAGDAGIALADACPPPEQLDPRQWRGEGSPGQTIGALRSAALGEFDRPDPARVLAYARGLMALGMGDEARLVLRSFAIPGDEAALLDEIARVIDRRPPPAGSRLRTLTSCPGYAGFWAFLAADDDTRRRIGSGPVLLSFAGLGPELRLALGPDLARAFLDIDEPAAARVIDNALLHADPDASDLVLARIDLAGGRPSEALARLDRLALSPAPGAPEALALAIERRLGAGEAVPPRLVSAAGGYLVELRGQAFRPRLQAAYILGLASLGDFPAAVAAYGEAVPDLPADRSDAVLSGLLARLAASADDGSLLRMLERTSALQEGREISAEARLAVGSRLADLGLAAMAEDVAGPVLAAPEGAALAARLALGRGDPAGALSRIEGMASPDAEGLRAQALAMLGRHREAAAALAALGAEEDSAREAWLSGDPGLVSRLASEPRKAGLASLMPATDSPGLPDGDPGPAVLARAKAALDRSSALRAAVAQLLPDDPVAANPSSSPRP